MRPVKINLLLALIAVIAAAPQAYAAGPPTGPSPANLFEIVKPGGENAGPSAGTLAAAALESAGYKAQEIVLRDLKDMFKYGGALIFVVCMIVGLVLFAVQGSSDGAAWMFIGPWLYLFVMTTKPVTGAVQWQFAAQPQLQQEVQKITDNQTGLTTQVSQVFNWWNVLISDIYRNFIAVLSQKEQKKEMMKLMSRARLTEQLLGSEIGGGGLRSLIWFTNSHPECNTVMNALRIDATSDRERELTGTSAYIEATRILNARKPNPPKTVSLDIPEAPKAYLQELLSKYASESYNRYQTENQSAGITIGSDTNDPYPAWGKCLVESVNVSGTTASARTDLLNGPVSCEQLFCWIMIGVDNEIHPQLLNGQRKLNLDKDPELWKEVSADIERKLVKPTIMRDQNGNPVYRRMPDAGIVPVLVGGHLVRKAMEADARSQMLSQFARHAGVHTGTVGFVDSGQTKAEEQALEIRNQLEVHTATQQWELYSFASLLPYAQGLLLYTLALTFPFFALMILIPGKAKVFFKWMALWAWVKSWDVGWVIVALVDDVLWNLMPFSSGIDIQREQGTTPANILEAAFQADPAYTLTGYYMLIGILLTGVPMITAQIILGSKSVLASTLQSGLSALTSKLGGYGRDWMKTQTASAPDYLRDLRFIQATRNGVEAMETLAALKDLAKLNHPELKTDQERMKWAEGELAKTWGGSQGLGARKKVQGQLEEVQKTLGQQKAWAEGWTTAGTAATVGGTLLALKRRDIFTALALTSGATAYSNAYDLSQRYATLYRTNKNWQASEVRIRAGTVAGLERYDPLFKKLSRIRASGTNRAEFGNLSEPETAAKKSSEEMKLQIEMRNAYERTYTQTAGIAQEVKAFAHTGTRFIGLGVE